MRRAKQQWARMPSYAKLSFVPFILVGLFVGGRYLYIQQWYNLNPNVSQLLTKSIARSGGVTETKTGFSFDLAKQQTLGDFEAPRAPGYSNTGQLVAAVTPTESTSNTPYQVTLSKRSADGIKFGDSEGNLSFEMIPLFAKQAGRAQEGRVVYPISSNVTAVYTPKRNGIKEDIIVSSKPKANTQTYSWTLETGDKLEAKMQPDGSVGIYSGDPMLGGDITVGDTKSQELLDKARRSGAKTQLSFMIPKPYVVDADGHKSFDDVAFSLDGNTLTLTVGKLRERQYPLSIDPSIVVTSTADFRTGIDDGMIDYSTAGQITRSNVSIGTVGAWHYTHNSTDDNTTFVSGFTTARSFHASVAYNGYLYVLGGSNGSLRNDVQYAPINSNGTIGSWTATNSFTTARNYHTAVAYNGYLYVLGGEGGSFLNDVQYAPINSNGTIGTWAYTTSFTTARDAHTSVAYNGYLYIIGGENGSNLEDVQYAPINTNGSIGTWTYTTSFSAGRFNHTSVAYNGYLYVVGGYNGVFLTDVQFAPINSSGTIGPWTATSNFSTTRNAHTSVAYNGYLYVIGGYDNSYLADVQYAPINSNGTIGSWTATASFITGRRGHTSVAYNGYVYVVGGEDATSDTDCNGTASIYCSDVQFAPINTGTPTFGTLGATWNTTRDFSDGREGHTSVALNGYLYILGGWNGTSYLDTVQYARIDPDGTLGPWAATTSFGTTRYGHASVAYNGYLYVMGGNNGGAAMDDVQYAPVNANGSVGAWTATTVLPTGRVNHTAVVYKGYIYITGGFGVAAMDSSLYAQINSNGTIGSWSTGTTFTTARYYHTSVAYNGYLYLIGGWDGSSYKLDVQYATINGDGSLGAWAGTTSFNTARRAHTSVAYNGYMYIIGGYSGGFLATVEYAVINTNGTVGSWATTTSITPARELHSSVAYNGNLYVIGGGASGSTDYNTVQFTTIRSSARQASYERILNTGAGNTHLSNFTINGSFCSARLNYATAGDNGVFGSRVALNHVVAGTSYNLDSARQRYMLLRVVLDDQSCGGSANITDITLNYTYDPPDAPSLTGPPQGPTVNSWPANANSLVNARYRHRSVAYNGYLYVLGGWNAGYLATVEYAQINSDGTIGTWAYTTSFTTAREAFGSVAYNGYIYVIGGQGSTDQSDVQYAPINSNGTIGSWATTTALSATRHSFDAIAYNGFLYVIGGYTGSVQSDVRNGLLVTSTSPIFYLSATQPQSGYLRYRLDVCADSNCGTIVRSVDQSASQTGWAGQDQQSNTAYSGSPYLEVSRKAIYTYPGPVLDNGRTYYWRAYVIDPAQSNTWSAPAVRAFTTDYSVSVPVLLSPANASTGISTLPELRLVGSDAQSDYLRYRIEVCSTSNCSVVVRTIDQTASQTGWIGQGTQSGTAYTSGPTPGQSQVAIHNYQTAALSANTQYWWRASSIDPAGTNTWSSASAINTFTTGSATPNQVQIKGNVNIGGNVIINP
jgi:N-acetylneuraminic acid mutarotase